MVNILSVSSMDASPVTLSPPYFKLLRCSTVNCRISAFSNLADPFEITRYKNWLKGKDIVLSLQNSYRV